MAAATAAIVAGIGVAVSASSTVASFIQAKKQRELMEQANRDADAAMRQARKKLDVNYFDALGIQKEPYELQREALLSSGAQAIQAGVESGRGAAATAGRVQMAQNEAQAGIRTAMGEEMSDLEKLSATEESRLRDIGVQLDLEEVAGAQLAARDAQRASVAATEAGWAGVESIGQQIVGTTPYGAPAGGMGANKSAQKKSLSTVELSPEEQKKFNEASKLAGPPAPEGLGNPQSKDFSNVGSMTDKEYKQFLKSLSKEQKQMLFNNPQYLESISGINPFEIKR